jgi:hypothetical protein
MTFGRPTFCSTPTPTAVSARSRSTGPGLGWLGRSRPRPCQPLLDATASGYLPPDRFAELDHEVLNAYLDGLAETGWHGPPTPIQAGHHATAALRFGLDGPALLALAGNPARHAILEQRHGQPIADIIACRAAVIHYALQLADRARTLLNTPHTLPR